MPSHASKKRRRCGVSILKAILLATVAFLALALAACNGGGGDPSPPAPSGGVGPERVTYQAEDGLRIVADFYAPQDAEPVPAVLLLHQFGGSRDQWASLIPDLLEEGYAVLAPDLRSFGDSSVISRDGSEEEYDLENLDDMLLDVAAAITFLRGRNGVQPGTIGVVGASVGANLAYVASGAFPEVGASVSMSPNSNPAGGALLGSDIAGFQPRAVLFQSDEAEADDAQALADKVAQPVDVVVYEGATAHGVQLLANPRAKADIIGWLMANLPVVAGG